jgi:hypothetical protein
MTGHQTSMIRGCGPCHTATDSKCAACHDMVGQATNSSAFPHANRNISVKEVNASGAAEYKIVSSGNLWMYTGDRTLRDTDGNPSATGTANPELRVVEGATAWHTTPGNINDGTCLKCHGEGYFGLSGGTAYHVKGNVTDFTRK